MYTGVYILGFGGHVVYFLSGYCTPFLLTGINTCHAWLQKPIMKSGRNCDRKKKIKKISYDQHVKNIEFQFFFGYNDILS